MRRGGWLVWVALAIAGPVAAPSAPVAVAQEAAALLRPDERLTLKVREVKLATLLRFLAEVGGTVVVLDPAIHGVARQVAFEEARVEDALQQVLRAYGLAWRREDDKLIIQRGRLLPSFPPVPANNPDPFRPELVVPPQAP